MSVDSAPENPFTLSTDELARLDAIRTALAFPVSRNIVTLDNWGLADTYETYLRTAKYAEVSITMSDGTVLDAALSVPRDVEPASCPAIVMPAPLIGIGWRAYLGMFPRWALGGYAVLAYSQRGLAASTGEIDVAGPLDVNDGSEVIDWLFEQGVSGSRVGCVGSSYGAGTSLLVAAHDPRVSAVAATSAWGDLFTSLFENETCHVKAFEALVQLFSEDRCSPEFRDVIEKVRSNSIDGEVMAFADVRSARNQLESYDRTRRRSC
ncbi:CocE/NonD family hydrolase [Amycolatopsis sp. CA-161197]|uniref:CocE/NonD family hydrolase n=1 Tax=Amycolatopsis sp. CA-161197 TaxID=3239922 RepID=UPI003D8E0699